MVSITYFSPIDNQSWVKANESHVILHLSQARYCSKGLPHPKVALVVSYNIPSVESGQALVTQ